MGFSRYCPSSLDLTNFVVRSCRGAVPRLSLADNLESGNLGIWKSRNLEIWESKNLGIWDPRKSPQTKSSKSKSVSPKMSARSGLVGKNPPSPIWGHLGPFFAWAEQIQKIALFSPIFAILPVWGPCCYPPEVGQ